MSKKKYRVSSFSLVGEVRQTSTKKGKIKYLQLATEEDKYWIKVTKKIRSKLKSEITTGCRLEVAGERKQHRKTGQVKLKASKVNLLSCNLKPADVEIKEKKVSLEPIFDRQKKVKAKVLICQKNNCWKHGGKEICEQLESIFAERGLDNEIEIKKTGCLKKCKQAPNIVMMPDKNRYSKVKCKQVPELVEKHLLV